MRTLVSGLIALSLLGAAHEAREEVVEPGVEVEIKMRRPHAPHREGEHRAEPDEKAVAG